MTAVRLISFLVFTSLLSCRPQTEINSSIQSEQDTPGVQVMFHPYDPTLKTIATWVSEAQETIEIAIYNIDTSDANPVIKALKSETVKQRILAKELKVRLIFEGYGSRSENEAKSHDLEELGIDVRWLHSGRKVHHKFGVFDGKSVVTGSANWSLSSRRAYNENMLFVRDHKALASEFREEFYRLWNASDEFGQTIHTQDVELNPEADDLALDGFFNSDNFTFDGLNVRVRPEPTYTLTRELEQAIQSATSSIRIATTRIKLRPIFDALLAKAKPHRLPDGRQSPGLPIEIVVNMDQYDYKSMRQNWELSSCPDAYEKECSSGVNFSHFLSLDDFEGHENVTVRIKYFNLSPRSYLSRQMHSKYLIIDDHKVWTGSFNWSYSGEYSHMENVVAIDGEVYPEVVAAFIHDHQRIFTLDRDSYESFVKELERRLQQGEQGSCQFEMSLTFDEVDYLLDTAKRTGHRRLKDACN